MTKFSMKVARMLEDVHDELPEDVHDELPEDVHVASFPGLAWERG